MSKSQNLLDLLDDAASGSGMVGFLPDDPTLLSFAEIWRRSAATARWFSDRLGEGSCVAAVLTASPECLAAVVGAWRSGLTVASLPYPARAMGVQEYKALVERCCALVEAELLLVDDRYLPLLPALAVRAGGFGECARGGNRERAVGSGELVQFTSGSTGAPRGVRLTLEAVAQNVLALLEVVEPRRGDVACSWLPLSHDMGLIGMCLAPWVATARELAGDGTLWLIRTEAFLTDPALWIETCSTQRVTVTASPNFAFDLARRSLPATGQLDLGGLRVCVTGAEVVQAQTLRAFATATATAGFASSALSPAYGLAEATLAVTMVSPAVHWSSRTVDPAALTDGQWVEVDPGSGQELVCCGPPVRSARVRVVAAPGRQVGQIEVSGSSLLRQYVGENLPVEPGRWVATGDLGCLIDGDLYVTGRLDDVLLIGGRKLYAWEIEQIASAHPGIRTGNAVAVPTEGARYVLIAEPARVPASPFAEIGREVRGRLVERLGLGPAAILFVAAGSLPKTPSGKIQRHAVQARYQAGELGTDAVIHFATARRGGA